VLTEYYENKDRKLNRAKALIEKLKNERIDCKVSLDKIKAVKINFIGNIIISLEVIANFRIISIEY
jgi:hypothetical protein